jgi:splicing factor 3B subunit 3
MATTSHMFMYSLTIQPPTAITQAILGQFAGTKEQQIVTASGSKLTIHRPDPTQGKITPIFSQDVFGIIRSLAAFRLAGSSKGMFDVLPLRPNRKTNLVIRQASRAARSLSAEPT